MTDFNTFHASISPKTLDKVTRLFNASLTDIFNELIQNARRAGASRIDVRQTEGEQGPVIAFRDDGRGVADPRMLLSLGDSGWDLATMRREDPAGFGCFSLSPRGAVIRSRPRNADAGWSMTVTPEQFSGKAPVTVEPCVIETGTEIIFPAEATDHVRDALQNAARYCPVAVFFEGERLEQKDFLDGAIHVETWKGVRIGVFKRSCWSGSPSINFHGLTLKARLPSVDMAMERGPFSVRLDVSDCPDLKLVLPARKEVVQDAFFEELKTAVKRALYRAIAGLGEHRLSFASWQEARGLGVELPEAVGELRPYVPGTADSLDRIVPTPVVVPENACLVTFDGEPLEQQCFWQAMRKSDVDLPLFDPCPAYKGYAWYDALSRVTGMRCFVTEGSDTSEVFLTEQAGGGARPDRIAIEVAVRAPDETKRTLRLETDLLLTGDPWNVSLDEVGLFVTKNSDLSPGDLADLLEAGYFSSSDDACADSYETQQERFRDEARHIAITFLLSKEEADVALLKDAIRQDLLWLIPRDREMVITIKDCDIRIEQRIVSGDRCQG